MFWFFLVFIGRDALESELDRILTIMKNQNEEIERYNCCTSIIIVNEINNNNKKNVCGHK